MLHNPTDNTLMTTASTIKLRHNLLKKSLPYSIVPIGMLLCGSLQIWLYSRSALIAYIACYTTLAINSSQHPLLNRLSMLEPIRQSVKLLRTGLKSLFIDLDHDTCLQCEHAIHNTHTIYLQSTMYTLLYCALQPINYAGITAIYLHHKDPEMTYILIMATLGYFGIIQVAIDRLDFSSYTQFYQRNKAILPNNFMQLLSEGLPTHKLLEQESTAAKQPQALAK